MADTFTPFLNLTKPEVGASRDTWGNKQNSNLDSLDTWAKSVSDRLALFITNNTTAAQQVAGSFGVINYLDITRPDVARSRFIIGGSGELIVRNGDTGDDKFFITQQGRVWTKEIGFVADFINARAQAYAEDRAAGALNDAKDYTANSLEAIRTNNWTRTADLYISKVNPSIIFNHTNVFLARLYLGNDATLHYRNDSNANDLFRIDASGNLWCAPLGDIGDRIETRAAAFADNRSQAVGNARVVAVALQGAWSKSTGFGQTAADHPGVMTGIGINANGITVNITGRFVYYNTPNQGWVGASSI